MRLLLKKISFNLIVFVTCTCVKLIKFHKNHNLNFLKSISFKKVNIEIFGKRRKNETTQMNSLKKKKKDGLLFSKVKLNIKIVCTLYIAYIKDFIKNCSFYTHMD